MRQVLDIQLPLTAVCENAYRSQDTRTSQKDPFWIAGRAGHTAGGIGLSPSLSFRFVEEAGDCALPLTTGQSRLKTGQRWAMGA